MGELQKKFEEGQLVLIWLEGSERRKYAHYEEELSADRLLPKWSLPFRVDHVYSPILASVKDLFTRRRRRVHITKARFIGTPQTDLQDEAWKEAMEAATKTMSDQRDKESNTPRVLGRS
eukprot:GHVN01077977.1.p1 GENE.GHVN01077977.1~~GHVN01077977.1.p1  ORF type:complete len:119 (+),score=4.09 GHVN01077977.1:423-779(+)